MAFIRGIMASVANTPSRYSSPKAHRGSVSSSGRAKHTMATSVNPRVMRNTVTPPQRSARAASRGCAPQESRFPAASSTPTCPAVNPLANR